jgi:hypothetical protein
MRSLLRRITKFFALGEQPLCSPEAKARQAYYLWEEREKETRDNGYKPTWEHHNEPQPKTHRKL